MYEFGEDLIIESYTIPWLIWIQLMVMILIVIMLFYGFTIFSFDDSNQSNTTTASSSTTSQSHVNNNSTLNIIGSSHNTTVEGNQNIKRNAGTSMSREIVVEQVQEREGSSTKDAISFRPFQLPQHPCHYLGLAKQAFLKCLGLDSGTESSRDRKQHAKED